MNPIVSVVIPTFNRAPLIIEAVQSALCQTLNRIEVIVVDDGGTDNTIAQLRKIDDNRLRVFKRDTNYGVSACRNFGIKLSRGEFIAFLDSDDTWHPTKLEKQLKAFNEGAGVALVSCNASATRGGAKVGGNFSKEPTNLAKLLGLRYVCPTPTVIVRKRVLVDEAWFDTQMSGFEDVDLWIRLARYYVFHHVAETLVTIRKSRSSLVNNANKQLEGFRTLISKHYDLYVLNERREYKEAHIRMAKKLIFMGAFRECHRFTSVCKCPADLRGALLPYWAVTLPIIRHVLFFLMCIKRKV